MWARAEWGGARFELLIEAKKRNPEFVRWVFLPAVDRAEREVWAPALRPFMKTGGTGGKYWAVGREPARPARRRS